MFLWRTILLVMLWMSFAEVAIAEPAIDPSAPASSHLRGLSPDEAASLIKNLQDLQMKLRRGEDLYFELLLGAPASYPMTKVSPREAFLQMPFEKAFIIEQVKSDNPLWQPYKLKFAPNGPGQLIWNVEVVLGIHGQVERVEMVYEPPPPY